MEFGGHPGSFHALPSWDLPCNPRSHSMQVFPKSFLPRDSSCSIPGSCFHPIFSEEAAGTRLYLDISSERAGGAGSDLGLCRCFYYLGLCLPAWSRLFPNFERPRERRSPDPGSALLFPPKLRVLVPVQWQMLFFGIKVLLVRAGSLFIHCYWLWSCLPGIWDLILLGQSFPWLHQVPKKPA